MRFRSMRLCVTGAILFAAICGGLITLAMEPFIKLRDATNAIESRGGKVRWLLLYPKYITLGSAVTDVELVAMKPAFHDLWSIEAVTVLGSDVSADGLAELVALLNLSYLELHNSHMTDSDIEWLQERLPGVSVVVTNAVGLPP
jgi:hypothetical protein